MAPVLPALPALLALLAATAGPPTAQAMDPMNPSCPRALGWTSYPEMRFTVQDRPTHGDSGGGKVLVAEGMVDEAVPARLQAALDAAAAAGTPIEEIWLRSPGGDAVAGNAAGRLIRKAGIPTRIPAGWACFSACNFIFMGGPIRAIEPGGQFVVHMFTFTADRDTISREAKKDAVGLIGDIEQGSALLATDDNDFLIRMGVSRKLLTDVMYAQKAVATGEGPTATRRCLTQAEVFRYNVANLRE